MSMLVRPLASDDVEALSPLDEAYARSTGSETVVDAAALSFFARSGHSFVLEADGSARGFLLAQAVWDGRRPEVRVRRLVGDESGLAVLLEAVTKSAYDSGVYDITAEIPTADAPAGAALAGGGYRPRPVALFTRVLGSRGRDAGGGG